MSKKEEVLATLIEYGFTQEQSNEAWEKTAVKTFEGALNYLVEQQTNDDDTQLNHNDSVPRSDNNKEEILAKSLKCDECGKLLKSAAEAELHAARSNHTSFSESAEEVKPLTQEEKDLQMKKLEEKMKEKAKERQEIEKKQAIESEKKRREMGKEIAEAKKDRELVEAKLIAEQRRREKEDDRRAKIRIKEEIERDRKAKIAERESEKNMSKAIASSTTGATKIQSSTVSKTYTECKINIKLADGTSLSSAFKPEDALSVVREYITNASGDARFNMRTTFPTRVYSSDEEYKSLKELGLVPSATLYCNRF